jgi:hypothetical protein
MRMYCDGEKTYLEILTDLQVSSLPEYEKVVFGMPNMCLLDACMDMPLASV